MIVRYRVGGGEDRSQSKSVSCHHSPTLFTSTALQLF